MVYGIGNLSRAPITRHTFTLYPMRVSKNVWNSHHFGQFFRRERDAVSRVFFKSPENQGKDTLLYSITSTTVVGWGLCGMFLLLFDKPSCF